MEIKTVTVSMGRTVNRGNFENTRYDVSITAVLTPEEFEAEGADAVTEAVRSELVWAMYNDMHAELEDVSWTHFDNTPLDAQNRTERALSNSPVFRHMWAVDEFMAERLLLEYVASKEKWEKVAAVEAPDIAEVVVEQTITIETEEVEGDGHPAS